MRPDYGRDCHDPFLLPDMDKAVERLVQAHAKQEKIVIYGDYDIDGLTASAILLDSFEKFGLSASVFIPNRFIEGYGLAISAVKKIAESGTSLMVTVDCGSLSHKEIALAESLGMDVIVTDHHAVAKTKSSSVAMINPKWWAQEYPERYDDKLRLRSLQSDKTDSSKASNQKAELYPFLDLAGCGVAFKLVQALQTRLEGIPKGQEKWLLDLVAFGTVCDVVQLIDENRLFVYWGLQVMSKTRRIGLKMLQAVARVETSQLNARSLGFALGPRVNASGRLETAKYALDLLTTTDRHKALVLAERLDDMNAERRAEQSRIFKEASEQALAYQQDSVLVVSSQSWNHGIVGIVAAKLLEKYHKPTFVLQELSDGTAKGSARSFGDFSAVEAIRATELLLIKGGGHKLAAGVTLEATKIDSWRLAINKHYSSLQLTNQEKHLLPKTDVELKDFTSLDESLLVELSLLEPYGHGNPEPVFFVREATVRDRRTMGADQQHVKYTFADSNDQSMQMIAFNQAGDWTAQPGETVQIWFELSLNEWQGRRSVEGKLLRLEVV